MYALHYALRMWIYWHFQGVIFKPAGLLSSAIVCCDSIHGYYFKMCAYSSHELLFGGMYLQCQRPSSPSHQSSSIVMSTSRDVCKSPWCVMMQKFLIALKWSLWNDLAHQAVLFLIPLQTSRLVHSPGDVLGGYMPHWQSHPRRYRRSNINSQEKKYKCEYPGCGKAYYQRNNLLHHQTYKHGRQRLCRRRRLSDGTADLSLHNTFQGQQAFLPPDLQSKAKSSD